MLLGPGNVPELADEDQDEEPETEELRAEALRGRVRLTQAPPVVHQEWALPAGVVFEVRLDRPLPAAVSAQVGAVVQEVEALADRLRDLVADEASA